MISVADTSADDMVPGVEDMSSLRYMGEGSGAFAGKTYKYDEYADAGGQQLFYFVDAGALKGIRVLTTDGETSDLEILLFDNNVPDSIFDIPSDYTVLG